MSDNVLDPLRRLARLHGVLPVYRDGFKRFRAASEETLLAVLRELGVAIDRREQAAGCLLEGRIARWSRLAPPTAVVWGDDPLRLNLHLPADFDGAVAWELMREDGERQFGERRLEDLAPVGAVRLDGRERRALRLELHPTPPGRHRLRIAAGADAAETHVIAAPKRCHLPEQKGLWGVFLPLYALRTERDWGAGDFRDLEALSAWSRSLGGAVVGTLPLLAAFLDEPFEYSPYVPASRLFWNELYLDLGDPPPQAAELRQASLVDYRRLAALKRSALESRLATIDPAALEAHLQNRPELEAYARFRAITETDGPWTGWAERQRGGLVEPGDYDERRFRYHVLAQKMAAEQLAGLAARAAEPGLYLDLPLGVHPAGFDVWRAPESFAAGVAGGAPPDRFFTKGQNWSFSPLHPQQIREDGLDYWFRCLRHHLEHAGVLRLDHFMGLHRLYWIPRGAEASEGTYVQYPAEELYAAVCLESARNQAWIIGEDLGTVPKYVQKRMAEHAIDRMYVAQFSVRDNPRAALEPSPANAVAAVNTHDTPSWAAFWAGEDIDGQVEMGLLTEDEAALAREGRKRARAALAAYFGTAEDGAAVLRAVVEDMGAGAARAVIVTLEDLWGETAPQNTPGTGPERPN
ncbi:MAG: 4-alpha-glucanotransferase, partial [Acidobacteria bacterium]|nr:4-alpha-glucanotransferase [Acidobacteriota bacterium]